jgi:hypothetical protein
VMPFVNEPTWIGIEIPFEIVRRCDSIHCAQISQAGDIPIFYGTTP